MQNENQLPSDLDCNAQNDKGQDPAQDATTPGDAGEFRLTVRKIVAPVRPRGVLAE